jgi:hypothetical protein
MPGGIGKEKIMEMTLTMPQGAILMDAEEMTYVEGGGTISVTFSKAFLQNALTAGVAAIVTIAVAAICAQFPLLTPFAGTVIKASSAFVSAVIAGVVARSLITSDKTLSLSFFLLPNWSTRVN